MAYIDREKLIEAIRKYADTKHSNGEQIEYINGILKSISVVNEQPTADVVEVAEITEKIDFAIKATNMNSDYDVGLRNGLRLALSFIDGKQPQYERK